MGMGDAAIASREVAGHDTLDQAYKFFESVVTYENIQRTFSDARQQRVRPLRENLFGDDLPQIQHSSASVPRVRLLRAEAVARIPPIGLDSGVGWDLLSTIYGAMISR
jgi:hypothetical protein